MEIPTPGKEMAEEEEILEEDEELQEAAVGDESSSPSEHLDHSDLDSGIDDLNEDAHEAYKTRMVQMISNKRKAEELLMASLKPIKVKKNSKRKKSKAKITLVAIKPSPGDMYLMEHHLVEVKVKQK